MLAESLAVIAKGSAGDSVTGKMRHYPQNLETTTRECWKYLEIHY